MDTNWIKPNWDVSEKIGCVSTTRIGGLSEGQYAGLNLSTHVGDDEDDVIKNRRFLVDKLQLPSEPTWLDQQHDKDVINLSMSNQANYQVDASYTVDRNFVCVVLTADCLPVLFCDLDETCVAVAHAGWRGLNRGVLENTIDVLPVNRDKLKCWLGPAIGNQKFEVGSEVRQAFIENDPIHENAFKFSAEDKYLADIYQMARNILTHNGVQAIFGGGFCTYSDEKRFYSYRRDGQTGRMATLIWLKE